VTVAYFYSRGDGDELLPTELAAGPPWLPGTQHGSAVTALMARAVEATPAATEMHLSRLTVDLSRPVPFGTTTVEATIVRDGRRLQVLDVVLRVDGQSYSRASAMRLRIDDGVVGPVDRPAPWPDDIDVPQPTSEGVASPFERDTLWSAHEARWESYSPGTGAVWLRPTRALVEGEGMSATMRVAMIADLVMSGGGLLPPDRYLVVNTDLTLALARPPESDWILIRSRVRLGPDGAGQSEGALYDELGWIGRALKSLLVDRR
jgi:hypothetical protein